MTIPTPPSTAQVLLRRVVTIAIAGGILIFGNALAGLLPLSFIVQPLAVGVLGYYAVETIKGQW